MPGATQAKVKTAMRPAVAAAIVVVAVVSTAALAQNAPEPKHPAAAAPAAKPRGITRDEYVHRAGERAGHRAGKRFDEMDANHDGILEHSEIEAWRAAHPRHRRKPE